MIPRQKCSTTLRETTLKQINSFQIFAFPTSRWPCKLSHSLRLQAWPMLVEGNLERLTMPLIRTIPCWTQTRLDSAQACISQPLIPTMHTRIEDEKWVEIPAYFFTTFHYVFNRQRSISGAFCFSRIAFCWKRSLSGSPRNMKHHCSIFRASILYKYLLNKRCQVASSAFSGVHSLAGQNAGCLPSSIKL
jgi:hypothetical protein